MKTYTFTISEQHLQIISAALGKLSYEAVAETIHELQTQVNAQNQPEPPRVVSGDDKAA